MLVKKRKEDIFSFIGIDQSYTSTGIVVLDKKREIIHYEIISSDSKEDIYIRAWNISEEIKKVIMKFENACVAIEGLPYLMRGNATRDLAGLQFLIVSKIKCDLEKEITIVSPTTIKKFATGNGRSNKNEMIKVLPPKIFNFFFHEKGIKKTKGLSDLCDAYFLAIYLVDKYSHGKN